MLVQNEQFKHFLLSMHLVRSTCCFILGSLLHFAKIIIKIVLVEKASRSRVKKQREVAMQGRAEECD